MNKGLKTMMCGLLLAAGAAMAEDLVILTTNDTHSNIDTDVSGAGGVLPRTAIIDSVRDRKSTRLNSSH